MVSLSRKIGTALALFLGALLVVTGFSAPAQAAIARSITISASPTAVFTGTPVTYSGTLTKSPLGSTVRIQRKSGTSWVLARTTTTTTAGGKYSVRLNAPATGGAYQFRAFAPASGTRAAATSRVITVTALNRTVATLNAPTSIAQGQSAVLSGTVSPKVTGTAVLVQRLSGASWVSETATQVLSNGTYSVPVTPSATTTYRVQVPRAGFNGGATTPSRTVTVVPPGNAPTITTTVLPNGAKNVNYTATLEKTGGAGTWTRTAGTLPAGLTLASSGVISGKPTNSGTSNFTVTFTETSSGLTASKPLSITVTPPPVITTSSLPDATRGTAYSVTLEKTGQAGTWSLAPDNELPDGLTLNPTTGVISGIPADKTGLYAVYPVFTETGTGLSTFKPLGLTITGTDVAITTAATLPNGTKGQPYSVTLEKTGLPGTWAPFGDLPPGLTLNPTTGVLSGTPTAHGLYAVYVVYTETATNAVATKGFSLTIANSPVVTTKTLPDGTTGSAYSQQLAATGNAGTWAWTGGQLPAGVTVSSSGLVSGTPTVAGDYGFSVTYTETSTGYSDKQTLLLHVSDPGAPVINTTTLPSGTVGAAYNATLSAVGSGTWSVSYGTLPDGLTLNPTTGAITGTPIVGSQGDWLFQVTFTSGGKSNTKVLGIHIDPAPAG